MKIREIFNETKIDPAIMEFAGAVKKYCQPYLKLTGGDFTKYALYRGLTSTSDSGFSSDRIVIKNVRLDDRRPADTQKSDHNTVNSWMVDRFGEPFRNALFATPNIHEASEYGEVYLTVPMGEFTYLWSPKVTDLYSLLSPKNRPERRNPDSTLKQEYLDSLQYTNKNFLKLFNTNNEVMIRCKKYIGFRLQTDIRGLPNLLSDITDAITYST